MWRPRRRSSEAADDEVSESFARDPVKHGSEDVSAEKMDEEDIKAHYVKNLFHDIPAPYKHPETFQRVIITAEDHEFDQEAAEVRACEPRARGTAAQAPDAGDPPRPASGLPPPPAGCQNARKACLHQARRVLGLL